LFAGMHAQPAAAGNTEQKPISFFIFLGTPL
jgi:hypothetical protein